MQNVYSPTHALAIKRVNDKEVNIEFERNQGLLDKDFQMFYSTGDKDVGLTTLLHRPVASENGYAMMLLTPKVEMSKSYEVPRDMVMILDTSGSMNDEMKIQNAREGAKQLVKLLSEADHLSLPSTAKATGRARTFPSRRDEIS